MARREHSGRTIAIVGGAALALWLLSLGGGFGLRAPGTGKGGRISRRTVWIRADRIEIDGDAADLATVVAKSRAAGEVEVHATGDAVTRVVREVLEALHAAGVTIYAPVDLAYIVPAELLR